MFSGPATDLTNVRWVVLPSQTDDIVATCGSRPGTPLSWTREDTSGAATSPAGSVAKATAATAATAGMCRLEPR